LTIDGQYLFANHPAEIGIKSATVSRKIILITGISNSEPLPRSRYTIDGNTNCTLRIVTMTIPTTSGNVLLFLTALITKVAPRPVGIP
jgi:hypothetical protein